MPNTAETVLEINLKALKHNFEFIRSRIDPSVKFLAVVKAFAYGSDSVEVAKCLEELNVDYLAVAYAQEGIMLRDAGIRTPILVLHPQPVNFKSLIERCLEPSIYSPRILKSFIEVAKEENQVNYPVHLKFNTGLNRLGFWESDVDFIMNYLNKTTCVKVTSIFSHLAASEDVDEKEFTLNQIQSFTQSSTKLIERLGYVPIRHMTNTSGILNYPEAHFEMVRAGIGLYGFGNSKETNKSLKPIASLKTVISQIHDIEKGESVGYNRAYVASGFERIATIPIGHADGLGRHYGNRVGYVFVNGKKAHIIGNVCMDMTMIDITGIDCQEGDEVIIFNKDHSAEKLAETVGTISYELITAVSQRVKRVFYR